MKKITLILCILLVSALMILPIISCGGADGGNNGNNDGGNQNNDAQNPGADGAGDVPAEPEKVDALSVIAGLPDEDYGGYEFRIWTSNWFNTTLEGRQAPDEEQTGDLINDALYIRDKQIEEKYNIEIKYTIYAEADPVFQNSKKAINAGDDAFDFSMDMMMILAKGLSQGGMLVDFNAIPNIDLTKEWWSKYAIRDLTIDGRFFFPTGDITARYPGSQYLMLFNKKVFSDMGLEYPYQTVLEGNWTLDALFDITKGATKDLNGDGVLNKKDDFFGLVVETMAPICFLQASGEGLTNIVDGNPVVNIKNDRTIAIMEKMAEAWGDPYRVYYPPGYNTYDEVPIFKEDRALFAAMTGTNTSLFKDMESDFGIVPLPKYDANQPEYYSHCQPWGSAAVCVPITAKDLERTGMIIEAMAAGGRYTSTPAAYEITLKTKYARDEESEKMLDIICDGSRYDFAHIYDWGQLYSGFCSAINKGESYLTKFEASEGKIQTAMEKTIDAFANSD